MDLKAFGKRCAQIRNELGLKQPQFATRLGVSRQQVSAYENGEAWPKPRTLEALVALSGRDCEWLLTGRESEKRTVSSPRPKNPEERSLLEAAQRVLEGSRFVVGEKVAEEAAPYGPKFLELARQVAAAPENVQKAVRLIVEAETDSSPPKAHGAAAGRGQVAAREKAWSGR